MGDTPQQLTMSPFTNYKITGEQLLTLVQLRQLVPPAFNGVLGMPLEILYTSIAKNPIPAEQEP